MARMTRIQWPTATCIVLPLFLSNTTLAEEQEVQLEVQNMTLRVLQSLY